MRLLIIGFSFIFLFSCNQGKKKNVDNSKVHAKEVIHEEVLNIGKMHCEMCVVSIEKGLGSVEGVEFVNVKLEDSTAVVRYDESKTNIDELRTAIEKRGYILKNKILHR